jgi:hypothetical protein
LRATPSRAAWRRPLFSCGETLRDERLGFRKPLRMTSGRGCGRVTLRRFVDALGRKPGLFLVELDLCLGVDKFLVRLSKGGRARAALKSG